MKKISIVLAFLALLSFSPAFVSALSPIIQFQDLVAGNGNRGFEDGAFYSARFDHPYGMALNLDGSILYLADQSNNRIRVIYLDKKNQVETLAGTGVAGRQDGPVSTATFNEPTALAYLPGDKLAIYDLGNSLIRLLDLKTLNVSTLAGGGNVSADSADAAQVGLGQIWNLVYSSLDQNLYFTQPDEGLLRKLNIKTNRIETVLKGDPLAPHPGALAFVDGKLYLADQKLPQVYEVQMKAGPAVAPITPTVTPTFAPLAELKEVGKGVTILALAGNKDALYAYQFDPSAPIARIFPSPGPITFSSVWGYNLWNPAPGDLLPHFQNVNSFDHIGFIPDTRNDGRFYLTNPSHSVVWAFRDSRLRGHDDHTSGEDLGNSGGIHDLEYSFKKPPGTYRDPSRGAFLPLLDGER